MDVEHYTVAQVADKLSVSKQTVRNWEKSGKLLSVRHPINNYRLYKSKDIDQLSLFKELEDTISVSDYQHIKPRRIYKSIELFAGAGGLALGLERAGFQHVMLNEIDKYAAETLRTNRPKWNVIENDIRQVDFSPWEQKIDLVFGGFPCQAFSYAGKKLGFEDTRGTLFYEFARCVKETKPLICVGENVRGIINHDGGKTIATMISVLDDLGYDVVAPTILKAIDFEVPQKRERLFLVGLRKDAGLRFLFPTPFKELYTVRDALKKGRLFESDAPTSKGQKYPQRKAEILSMVPPGGYWRDLPLEVQKEYMMKSFYLGGGKTGMARRMSWDEPSLTLTCAPAQKQTERCHPDETRPFTVREYARIQTFPDDWIFSGSMSQQYKQIGNAVPVNLAYYLGQAVMKSLNSDVRD